MSERPLELLARTTERVRALVDGEAAIVGRDVSVSTRAVLSIDDCVCSHIVSHSLVDAHAVESSRVTPDVSRGGFHLVRRFVGNCKTSIVYGDVGVSIVATHAESLFESVALVDESGLEVRRKMHNAWFLQITMTAIEITILKRTN
jgi:hypothetical protein